MKEMSRRDLVDARIDFNITKEVTSNRVSLGVYKLVYTE